MRRIALALLAALAFAMPAAAQAPAAGTLDRVKSAGVLRACFAQVSPEAYKDARSGEWRGVFVDLTRELAEWMRVRMEIVEVQWPTIVPSLRRGDCDMVGGSLVYNAPRSMEIAYVRPMWAKGVNAILRRADAPRIRRPADLNSPDVTLAVVAGSSENEVARRQFPRARILALQVQSNIQIMESVRRGDATAALLPTLTLRWWLAVPENGAWGALAFPDAEFASAPNGWAVRYGDPDWARFLDAFVAWAEASGLTARLYEEYLDRANPFRP